MTAIESISTAVPEYRHSQEALCSFLETNLPMDEKAAQLLRRMASQSAIDGRYSVLPDFSQLPEQWSCLQKNQSGFTAGGMAGRMKLYFQHALPLSLKAISGLTFRAEEITHLIAVSCTGMAAPGLDLMLCEALNLRPETQRSCIHFMGCYAAIHALKQADYICRAQPEARVLIVCTELCTLHIRADLRPDNLASTLLFGDGAAAVLLCGEDHAVEKPLFQLRNFASVFLPSGKSGMAWHPDEEGFRMELGRFVPDLIGEGILDLLQRASGRNNPPQGWAIHPGGRKILDKVAEGLAIEKSALASSYQILKEFGNMSSPTVLFVLEREFRRLSEEEGLTGPVFAAAFGPGLTMESLVLETC